MTEVEMNMMLLLVPNRENGIYQFFHNPLLPINIYEGPIPRFPDYAQGKRSTTATDF